MGQLPSRAKQFDHAEPNGAHRLNHGAARSYAMAALHDLPEPSFALLKSEGAERMS
jgi:hypothetical protein